MRLMRVFSYLITVALLLSGCSSPNGVKDNWPSVEVSEEISNKRMEDAKRLFTGSQEELVEWFSKWDTEWRPIEIIEREGEIMPLEYSIDHSKFPQEFKVKSGIYTLDEFHKRWGTTGFLVIKDNKIINEEYFMGHSEDKKWMAFSASKAIIGVLTGIALEEGKISSLNQEITEHAPQFEDTAWEGITYEQVLNMTTGIDYDEEDITTSGDHYAISKTIADGRSVDEYIASLNKKWYSNFVTVGNYSSGDTQALTAALSGAVDMSASSYFQEKIWSKIGAEKDAFWVTDDFNRTIGLSGFNATLRDYGRLGIVYLTGVNWKGERLIPKQWIDDLQNPTSGNIGSWRHFKVLHDSYGDYAAVGSYGQVIYVNPHNNTVVVLHSVNPNIEIDDTTLEEQMLMSRQLSEAIDGE